MSAPLQRPPPTAVLGPTNTGKTHYAIERMLTHRTGVIGLPLRLLAREIYDKVKALRGPNAVALITGEERIVPPSPNYWVATVEAMPQEIGSDFVAVDEIQLCADPQRGHVFTDRLLHARGLMETLFLGAETMANVIREIEPKAQFLRRDRYSKLSYAGSKKLSRMPERSAIVSFSSETVYGIAELLRRQRGGAAVVMGNLSPRTRNAQVEMYQNGDVDFLVATDAIGMGLNLDVHHVAFSATSKFDGRRLRPLLPVELAQIAGRAGRYTTHGSFGVTGEAKPLDNAIVEKITENRFEPVRKLQWRNRALDFASPKALIRSLERPTSHEWLVRTGETDDLAALKALLEDPHIHGQVDGEQAVRLLWDVCCIPDFRAISQSEHAALLSQIFNDLNRNGRISQDWFARQVERTDRTHGDIDTISKRLAFVRTWTYVAQRANWIDDNTHWQEATRAVEDRLSDALHQGLLHRFVDRRTSVLASMLKQRERLVAEITDAGEVKIEGETLGWIEGFRFSQDKGNSPSEAKTLRQSAMAALAPEFILRADRLYNAPDTEIYISDQGGLMWGKMALGKLEKGDDPLRPTIKVFVDEEAGPDVIQKVERRLKHYLDRQIAAQFEPLFAMKNDETLAGLVRGFAFRLVESFGLIDRLDVAEDVKGLDQDARSVLRKHGVRFGQFTIFIPSLLKPAPTRLRMVLWSLFEGLDTLAEAPPPGLVTIPVTPEAAQTKTSLLMAGYKSAGKEAIRIDMLERLADLIRLQDTRKGFEATCDMLSITGTTLERFALIMEAIGYKAVKGEREKQPAPSAEATADAPTAEAQATPDPAAQETTTQEDAPAPEAQAEVAKVPPTGEAPSADQAPANNEATKQEAAEKPLEIFYTFTWGGNRPKSATSKPGHAARNGAPEKRDPNQKRTKKKNKPAYGASKPHPKAKKDTIDPDNPFVAALSGLLKKN